MSEMGMTDSRRSKATLQRAKEEDRISRAPANAGSRLIFAQTQDFVRNHESRKKCYLAIFGKRSREAVRSRISITDVLRRA